MQTFNNVQMNGWSYSPKHGPAHFTVLKQLFVRVIWNFFKNIQLDGYAMFFQTRPSSFHGVEEPFRLDVM